MGQVDVKSDIASRLKACTPDIAAQWLAALSAINPALAAASGRAALELLIEDLVTQVLAERFNLARAHELGARLESVDSFQPDDLQRAQEGVYDAFAACLCAEDWTRLQSRFVKLLFGMGAGFLITKIERASQFTMSAVSRMGHDLKTPINAITGFSRVILKGIDGPITDFQREDLTSIYEAGQQLLTMINDLYSVQKQDAARTLTYGSPYAVSELLSDVLRTVQPLAGERDCTLTLTATGALGTLCADASMVRWMLLSLLLHALREAITGTVALTTFRETGELSTLVLRVTYGVAEGSSGMAGLSADLRRASDWATEIGLVTCRRFCEELGGTLSCTAGETVSYTLRLPVDSLSS